MSQIAHHVAGTSGTVWEFVITNYPNYSQSAKIARFEDLSKIILDEYEDGDEASKILQEEFEGMTYHSELSHEIVELYLHIIHTSIEHSK